MVRMDNSYLYVSTTLLLKMLLTSFDVAAQNFITQLANIFENSWHRYLYAYLKLKPAFEF